VVRMKSRQALIILCELQQAHAFRDGRSNERASDLQHFFLIFFDSLHYSTNAVQQLLLGNDFPGLLFPHIHSPSVGSPVTNLTRAHGLFSMGNEFSNMKTQKKKVISRCGFLLRWHKFYSASCTTP
jgi:hypothetical protein